LVGELDALGARGLLSVQLIGVEKPDIVLGSEP
jgi:hypothetical protein